MRKSIICARKRWVSVFAGDACDDLMATMKASMTANILMQENSFMALTARPRPSPGQHSSSGVIYKSGKLKLNEIMARQYRLTQINDAFKALAGREVVRGAVPFV